MISWITIDILSRPRESTSGLEPWFSAIIRFWIRVESLKRPPTLLTISSSFNSSSIGDSASAAVLGQDRGQLVDGASEVVVGDLIIIEAGLRDLASGVRQPPLDGRLVVGAAAPEPGLQHLHLGAGRVDEDEQGVRDLLPDDHRPLDVDD